MLVKYKLKCNVIKKQRTWIIWEEHMQEIYTRVPFLRGNMSAPLSHPFLFVTAIVIELSRCGSQTAVNYWSSNGFINYSWFWMFCSTTRRGDSDCPHQHYTSCLFSLPKVCEQCYIEYLNTKEAILRPHAPKPRHSTTQEAIDGEGGRQRKSSTVMRLMSHERFIFSTLFFNFTSFSWCMPLSFIAHF